MVSQASDAVGLSSCDPTSPIDRRYEIDVTPEPDQFVLRCEGSAFTGRRSPAAHVLQAVREDLVAYIAEHARTHAFVHAGVVGCHGKAVVIPGRSRTGKSSLVAALIRAGATYYSDEYAPIDERGRVHPYARPLELRPPDGARRVSAESLGAAVGIEPLPVGWILKTHHAPGATWNPEKRGAGTGVLALFDNAVAARTRPAFVLPILRRAAEGAIVLDGPRGDADHTARAILAVVS